VFESTGTSALTLTPHDPNYTELLSYSDIDSLVELHGHIRAENSSFTLVGNVRDDYLRGELSGHLVLLGGIAWNEISVQSRRPDDNSFWRFDDRGMITHVCMPRLEASPVTTDQDTWLPALTYSPSQSIEHWENVFILAALSRLREGPTQVRVRSTETYAQVQYTALASILASIRAVIAAVVVAIRSIFIFVAAMTIIIRTLMAHRNSREPAYYPISRLPLYQSLAGVALAH